MILKALMAALLLMASATYAAPDFGVTGLGSSPAPVATDADHPSDWKARNDAVAKAAAEGKVTVAAPTADAPAPSTVQAYALGPGDKVRMTVFGETDLSGEFQVDNTGTMAVPLVGEMKVGGKTLRDAEKMITAKLSEGYLVNPRVTLEVLNFRPFFILGEVVKPGSYPCVNDLTVINAVAMAGGYTTRAKIGKVYVKRASTGKDEVEMQEDAQVYPGDVIRVDERFF